MILEDDFPLGVASAMLVEGSVDDIYDSLKNSTGQTTIIHS